MKLDRSSGVLLHITSLPGRYGIGTLGPEARQCADLLRKAGMRYWQILPIGPVDERLGYSPYASTSTFAGNFLFISLEKLAEETWFSGDIGPDPFTEDHIVPFNDVIKHKLPILKMAGDEFFSKAADAEKRDYDRFCKDEAYWLDDFALYSAVAEHTGEINWLEWDTGISMREPKSIAQWDKKLAGEIRLQKFIQYIFFRQWSKFRQYCKECNIQIIGDIPIYVTLESADAWANPDILILDEKTRRPLSVAGVPPDYFSDTGQRWGNPLYRWEAHEATGFAWWLERLQALAEELSRKHKVAATPIAGDLAQPDGVKRLIEAISANRLIIDGLVNNAGYGVPGYYARTRWEDQEAFLRQWWPRRANSHMCC